MRHKHNLSHDILMTCDQGQLIPVSLVEVLPGDVFNHSSNAFVRLTPMAAPVMHRMSVRMHHFFIPRRLTWDPAAAADFETFVTGGPDGNDATPVPTMSSTGTAKDLLDYLGIPTETGLTVASCPVRAYNMIWNEYYRDQDLATERALTDTSIARIAWEKTYETVARPWPQRGDEVTLPLGTKAPVTGIGKINNAFGQGGASVREAGGNVVSYGANDNASIDPATSNTQWRVEQDPDNAGFPNIYADLSNATAATVRAIREAFALQRISEARARYGARYTEYLRYLGVRPDDARIQRPEYLGGGVGRVSVSEILQTGPDSGDLGVGELFGHGISASSTPAYRRRFQEHGYVMTLFSTRPKLVFAQGIERTWLKTDREDFYQPELEHIGAQQVLEQELFADSTNAGNVFGYSDRYQEYRHQRSRVAGEFRTSDLNYWHMAQIYATAPVLNETFVQCQPTERIYNETTKHELLVAVQHKLTARRLVSRRMQPRIL